MNTNTEFDLKDFQRNVLSGLEGLNKHFDNARLFAERGYATWKPHPNKGLVKRILRSFANRSEKRANYFHLNSPYFVEREKKAKEILNNPEIKKILCPIFKKKIWSHFFKEELEIKVVVIVTSALIEKKIDKEFSFEKDEKIFSLIVYQILQEGIANYCANLN